MMVFESFCALCSDNLNAYIEYSSLAHLTEIEKINLPMTPDSKVCPCCYEFLVKIQRFIENSHKVQNFLNFISTNFTNPDDPNIHTTRSSFGLVVKSDQQTSTEDIDNPLEDNETEIYENLAEIPEENFVIEENIIVDAAEEVHEGDPEEEEINEEAIKDDEGKDDYEEADKEIDFICHICSVEFKAFIDLHNHTRKDHDCPPQVLCHCGSILTTRSQIQQHKKLHNSEKVFSCNDCDKVYSHQQSLQNHIKKHHDPEENPYVCNKCHKRFDSLRKVKIHAKVHLPDDKKLIHKCPYDECDKKFAKSVNVQAHIRAVHMKDKSFLCNECGKSFSTKGALKEHQIIHSDEFPYACQFCDKKFKNLPRLKTHEDTHGTTQYICNICGISLNTKRTLKMHSVVHSDQKKFKCEFCGSSFKRSKALKNHLILHSGLRPYACPFCDKTFANGSNCRSHKKKAHPQELAAYEAAGKAKPTPNIPRLEELMTKGQQDQVLMVDSSGMIIQEITPNDIKSEMMPSIVVHTT